MGIGINYVMPNYREVIFDSSIVHEIAVGKIIDVPEEHSVNELGKYDYARRKYPYDYIDSAPSGSEKMLVVKL